MIHQKILMVASYPITRPLHGGQKRARAIFDFYTAVFKEAKYVSVFHRGQYPDWDHEDLPLGQPNIIEKVDARPYASELISGEALYDDIHVRSPLAKLLIDYNPGIIHIEQPFAYIGLQKLLKELNLNPKIIYGSQNIEYILKHKIFEDLGISRSISNKLVAQTMQVEEILTQRADLVVAVNEEDASTHKTMGAKNCIVVPNGIDKQAPTQRESLYWADYKKKVGVKHLAIFVGSGHPPNWQSFLSIVGTSTRFLPKNCRIVVVGGVGDYFNAKFGDKKKYAAFWARLITVGNINDKRLSALLSICDVILLPILTPRGSNLKTAEAIISQKKIVATTQALKGFEKYRNLPNIYLASQPDQFRENIKTALRNEYEVPSLEDIKLSEDVLWQNCLQPLKAEAKHLALEISFDRYMHLVRRCGQLAKRRLLSILKIVKR